jgi:hypothetical protein
MADLKASASFAMKAGRCRGALLAEAAPILADRNHPASPFRRQLRDCGHDMGPLMPFMAPIIRKRADGPMMQ